MTIENPQLHRLAVEQLQQFGEAPFTEQQLGQAVLRALVQAGVNLRNGPTLEEMKQFLVDVLDSARQKIVST
jgi:hypothetical protein